jgi:hypothetical protein
MDVPIRSVASLLDPDRFAAAARLLSVTPAR